MSISVRLFTSHIIRETPENALA